jgi:hypothetical protein
MLLPITNEEINRTTEETHKATKGTHMKPVLHQGNHKQSMNPVNPTKTYVTTNKITRNLRTTEEITYPPSKSYNSRKLHEHRGNHITREEITLPLSKSHDHRGNHITHYFFSFALALL